MDLLEGGKGGEGRMGESGDTRWRLLALFIWSDRCQVSAEV